MSSHLRAVLIALLLGLGLVLVGPLLVPVPPLQDMVPEEQLADADSRFFEWRGLRVHYKELGQGEPVFLLLHGFGSSLYSWQQVMAPLAERGKVIAYDRPAFGLTSRPLPGSWRGQNPYGPEAQVDLLVALLDAREVNRAVLVGNSAGGTVAVSAALRYPERVQGLVLVDAAIYSGGGVPTWLKPLLRTPQGRHVGPLISRSFIGRAEDLLQLAWHDPSRISAATLAGYRKPLQVQNWDIALWEFTLASRSLGLDKRLAEVRWPVLVITGDDDRIVPTEQSVRLAGELPDSTLVVIPSCGHVPQEECPEAFLQAVHTYLASLPH